MHVLVGCNIENDNNGCLGAPQTDLLFYQPPVCFKSDAARQKNKQASKWGRVRRLCWNDYNSCFLIIIVTFFVCVCGCILRSLCCAIITDECMLGPVKRYPNGNIFWKGWDHQNPKKVLHPSLFSLIICTVKVCSSNPHLFFFFLTNSQLGPQAVLLFYFVRLKGLFVWNVVTRENCSLRHLPTREPAAVPLAFGKRMSVRIGARRRREQTSRMMTSPPCLSTEWVWPNSCGVQYVLENVQRPLCHLKNVCDRTLWHDPFLFVWNFFFLT